MTILNLREHSPDGGIRGVAVQDELTLISGKSQDISSNESIFQLLEGSLAFWRPEEKYPFFLKVCSGAAIAEKLRKNFYVSQCTKFEVSRFTRYDAVNGGGKCRKWGSLGQLRGTQGHRQYYHSIEHIRLPIRLQ